MRGAGLIAAIELVEDKATRRHFPNRGKVGTLCRDHSFKSGLIMRAVRDAMVLAPPLIISREEVDTLMDRARHAVNATARDLGRI